MNEKLTWKNTHTQNPIKWEWNYVRARILWNFQCGKMRKKEISNVSTNTYTHTHTLALREAAKEKIIINNSVKTKVIKITTKKDGWKMHANSTWWEIWMEYKTASKSELDARSGCRAVALAALIVRCTDEQRNKITIQLLSFIRFILVRIGKKSDSNYMLCWFAQTAVSIN